LRFGGSKDVQGAVRRRAHVQRAVRRLAAAPLQVQVQVQAQAQAQVRSRISSVEARQRRTSHLRRPATWQDSQVPEVLDPTISDRLKRDDAGLVAAVVQQHDTGEVLMVGWMDDEALRRTLTEGRVTFWSRSREEYWRKGDTSGHAQYVKAVSMDCDGDALLVQVDQVGAACHTGTRTCFDAGGDLGAVVGERDEQHVAERNQRDEEYR
jgi:phosphoribosyl-AMP cyclohydrolase